MRLRYCALFAALLALALPARSAFAADTDGDGYSDALETALGSDPASSTSVPAGGTAGQNFPINKAVASVRINFTKGVGRVRVGAVLPLPQGVDFANKTVAIDLGDATRVFPLDAGGLNVRFEDVFATVPGALADGRFGATFGGPNVPAAFSDDDLTAGSSKQVSLPLSVVMEGRLFTATVSGSFFTSTLKNGDQVGEAFLFGGTGQQPSALPVFPVLKNTLFAVNPSPARANEEVTFSAAAATTDTDGILGSILLFGDGTPPVTSTGNLFANGATVKHTYRGERGYTARLILIGAGGVLQSRNFIIVGNNTALNRFSGIGSTVSKNGLNLGFQINTENVENVAKVLTTFQDTLLQQPVGAAPAAARGVSSRETAVEGEVPSRTLSGAGITVATTETQDASATTTAKVRKQVTVSSADAGASDALPAPVSTEIVVTKMTGKFLFTSSKADQVLFQGEITLPTGFQPARPDGNTFIFGIGNVVDSIVVDSKGKPLNKSKGANGYFKSLKITYPRLPKGQSLTTGGEIAKVRITMSLPDMDAAGFDTEGITAELREDEADQSVIERYIQVSMLLGGVAYEDVATVQFKLSTKEDKGSILTRSLAK